MAFGISKKSHTLHAYITQGLSWETVIKDIVTGLTFGLTLEHL